MGINKSSLKDYVILHLLFLLYSLGGIISKIAAGQNLFSITFLLFYFLILLILFIYAILWQQILKRIELSTAFLNKSIVIIWGMFWGMILFNEQIKINMIIGAAIIVFGVFLVVTSHE